MPMTLSLRVNPDWDEIEQVRLQSAQFLQQHGLPADVVDALSMVTCELTENAVKYGHYDGAVKNIEVAVSLSGDSVIVEVKSPVGERDQGDLARLDEMIQWIRGHQDPFEAYLGRLKEVSAQSLTDEESGLGLVRIAYEGQSILDFYVDDRNVVSVSAVHPLGTAPGAQP